MYMTERLRSKIVEAACRAACCTGEAAELRQDDVEDTTNATRSQREIARDAGASDKKPHTNHSSYSERRVVTSLLVRAHSRRRTAQGAGHTSRLRRASI